jgi:adenylate cyclase class 2
MEEFEITFLEIDVGMVENKLLEIGAEKKGEYHYKRALFDYPDFRMNQKHSWLRLRTNGAETTLTYKERIGVLSEDGSIPDEGMKEIEIIVDNYDKTYELLKAVGFVIKREEENKRIQYKKDETTFDIDSWPQIPTYLEVESSSLEEAREAARLIGFNPKDGLIFSPKQAYQKYGYNLDDYSSITFDKFTKK